MPYRARTRSNTPPIKNVYEFSAAAGSRTRDSRWPRCWPGPRRRAAGPHPAQARGAHVLAGTAVLRSSRCSATARRVVGGDVHRPGGLPGHRHRRRFAWVARRSPAEVGSITGIVAAAGGWGLLPAAGDGCDVRLGGPRLHARALTARGDGTAGARLTALRLHAHEPGRPRRRVNDQPHTGGSIEEPLERRAGSSPPGALR